MNEQKKIPLSAGKQKTKNKTRPAATLLVCLIVAGAIFIYFLPSSPKEISSTEAFIGNELIEIQTLSSGEVEYIASVGQLIAANEIVLKLKNTDSQKIIEDAQAVILQQAGEMPQRARNLMLHYLSIPHDDAELENILKEAGKVEKELKAELDALAERQAMFRLELRRLELKHKKLPEEEERLKAMQIEEILLERSLIEAQKNFETASLERATAEKQLRTKRELFDALSTLPMAERRQFLAVQGEFSKISEAEKAITNSIGVSHKSGIVLYTVLKSGKNTEAAKTALYILPDSEKDLWIAAYFNEKAAAKIILGSPCLIKIADAEDVTLNGIIAEYLPYVEQPGSKDIPFKVTIEQGAEAKLAGLEPKTKLQVIIK